MMKQNVIKNKNKTLMLMTQENKVLCTELAKADGWSLGSLLLFFHFDFAA